MAALPPPRVFNVVRLIVQGACIAHGVSREYAASWLGISDKTLNRALSRNHITTWGNIALFGSLLGLAPRDMISLVSWTQLRVEVESYTGDDLADFPEIWAFVQEAAAVVDLDKFEPPALAGRPKIALDLKRRAAEGRLGLAKGEAVAGLDPAAWVSAMLEFPELDPAGETPGPPEIERLIRGLKDRARNLGEEARALRGLVSLLAESTRR